MSKAHVIMLPFPAQGHVTPLMELSHRLVDHGFEVTFVNTEMHHARVLRALPAAAAVLGGIHLASIPDGLANDEDRSDVNKLTDSCRRNMPGNLERLVAEMEAAGRPKVRWLVGDLTAGFCFEAVKKLGIRVASLWPASAACLAAMLNIPKLIDEGLFGDHGWPERDETLQLGPGMPPLQTSLMPWMDKTGVPIAHPALFEVFSRINKFNEFAEVVVCNSFHEAETGAFPDILAIGPLFADRKPVGHLLPEDERCIKWLDGHPDRSVVYVAFGSMAIFHPRELEELADGLELTGRPFLWVVRPDFTPGLGKAWLHEFRQRVAGKGMIVSWCSQQQVLAHRAVACFVSHCGWNSTMEGMTNGVPFLCWPYFCDQFLNRSYITSVWRTGLAVAPDADGIITREELRGKVEQVVADAEIRERARLFKDAARRCISQGGVLVRELRKVCEATESHCGCNSTIEGVLHGVPFLCCPYFADQFCNQSYVYNVWKTGLKLCSNEQGVVTKEEIRAKVVQLLGDEHIKARAIMWKNKACASIREGGSSHENLLRLALRGGDGACMPTPAVYCIGPLVNGGGKSAESGGERHECLTWLDEQPKRSVVFLCFGSKGAFSSAQLREIARGLERSGHRFLWAVRSPPEEQSQFPEPELERLLPAGFL
ncbi:hypothetical protein U9M48_030300 [Paspalum notatum var. saurae]|uniref:Glycosyltransferase N-terminal domain-containing protein n=1 Tax=Paspalum notatum var. saurae TaxID=547442 RepID=A0AAQ3U0R9_PASNO